jgi:uncharacterized protein
VTREDFAELSVEQGSLTMNYFVYKLIPPRPTFDEDMSEAAETMGQHFGYWQGVIDRGQVVVYGPVSDPSGVWGLAVLEVESEDEARALATADPAPRRRVVGCLEDFTIDRVLGDVVEIRALSEGPPGS